MRKLSIITFTIMGLYLQVQNQVQCINELRTNNIAIDILYLDSSDELPFPIGLV